jgi:DNA-binding transcriptional ArsR family regulator
MKIDFDTLLEGAEDAETLLKSLSNSNRLLILCQLIGGEKSVGELESVIEIRQPTLSQQLARLRNDELVTTRRDGKTIYYSMASDESRAVIELLYKLYCNPERIAAKRAAGAGRRVTA